MKSVLAQLCRAPPQCRQGDPPTHPTPPHGELLLNQSIVLCDALSAELLQDVVQVSGIREAVARQVGTKLCLVVNLWLVWQ